MLRAPRIDDRTAREIVEQVYGLLPDCVPEWPERGQEGELAAALIHIFARFNEIIIDRLNKTPEKNFFAFLDLLGVSPLPLQPARVPVTFYLAGNATHALVPMATQVAAPPPPGQQKPIIFETERDLVVVSARLESLIIKDGGNDQCIDFSVILPPPAPAASPAPEAGASPAAVVVPIPHLFYIPLPVYPVWPPANEIRLKFALGADLPAPITPRVLHWELCVTERPKANKLQMSPAAGPIHADDPLGAVVLEPLFDGTANLTTSGDLVFLNIPEVPSLTVNRVSGKWLRCRILTPLASFGESAAGRLSPAQLPTIKSLAIESRVVRTGVPPEQAFFNNLKLDTSKDFFPFGEKPKFGDTLYLANREGFSSGDAVVTLHVAVTNPASSGAEKPPLPPAKPQDVKLRWEYWDGTAWVELGTSEVSPQKRVRIRLETAEGPDTGFTDTTQVFSESGDISFKFPKPPAPLNLNGQTNYWVRVRITAGDYGKEAHYEHKEGFVERELRGGFVLVPATFAPPSIRSIAIDYLVRSESQPDTVITYNDFTYAMVDPRTQPLQPFIPLSPDGVSPSFYFGFTILPTLAGTRSAFPHQAVSAYVEIVESELGQVREPESGSPKVTWEYWNGAAWNELMVLDDTQGLRRPGIIRFLAPPDFSLGEQFGASRYWLRMRQDEPQFQPSFGRVLLNTTMALQGATMTNEVLGASNGMQNQRFLTTQAPVLEGQKVEVRESTRPSHKECVGIESEEGPDAIVLVRGPAGKGDAFWIRWHEVPTFYGSGPRDRHYRIDRMTGEITFGDGTMGMIPPALSGNIRASYRTGGGAAGNQPPNAITQLKSAVPYVQKAANLVAASGGTDPEPDAAVLARGPLGIRHGGRAVTREDFEDLAMLASREVARAKSVPLYDLTEDPDARNKKTGVVSLIIVPHSTHARPRPTQDLLDRVRRYIDARRQLTADLKLVRPEYLRVEVSCEITIFEPEAASEVEKATNMALNDYLHPVTGGSDGTGWDFGREPKRSDFFALLEAIPGVSHVRELRIRLVADRPGSERTGRFLICRGEHRVITTLAE